MTAPPGQLVTLQPFNALKKGTFVICFIISKLYHIPDHHLALIFTFSFQANITLNKGKDFTEDTLEMIVRGPPASFSVIEGSEYEFWRRGAKTFLTEELVYQANLLKFNFHTQIIFSDPKSALQNKSIVYHLYINLNC